MIDLDLAAFFLGVMVGAALAAFIVARFGGGKTW